MLRIIGAALILFTSMALGNKIASNYRLRPKILQEIETILEMAASEINYVATPLPVLLSKLGRRFPKSAGKIFSNLNYYLAQEGCPPDEAIVAARDKLESDLPLLEEDWEIIENFTINLGKSDTDEQLRHIELCLSHIRVNQKLALEDRKKSEKMWRYLGVLTGLLLVILIW
ncbi:stage III sporulation protein AB [Natranaerobius trueperi]|uniref:stage III sporulation protein AB n=1 Tax=Natranaerobius trueperi TaxID=759412 RepID=UPI0013033D37|nr:stage III sporulation protein AB [Natranaerobius trueperi]